MVRWRVPRLEYSTDTLREFAEVGEASEDIETFGRGGWVGNVQMKANRRFVNHLARRAIMFAQRCVADARGTCGSPGTPSLRGIPTRSHRE